MQRLLTERFDLVNQPRKSIDVSAWEGVSTVKRLDELPADVPDLPVILPARQRSPISRTVRRLPSLSWTACRIGVLENLPYAGFQQFNMYS